MTFTIDELEALKEGTTPGPWVAVADYPHISIVESADEDGRATSIADIVSAKPEIIPDQNLMAAAPALLDQLIAAETKLQQLKDQLEGLADWHDTKAMKARDFPWPGGQHAARFRGKAEAHETARNKLTQILEGQQ